MAARLGRLVWPPARQGRLPELLPGSVPSRPGRVRLEWLTEPSELSCPTPGSVPLELLAGAHFDGL